MPELEMFGAWLTMRDFITRPSLRPFMAHRWPLYLVAARCSTRCHYAEEILDGARLDLLDALEDRIRLMFEGLHGGTTHA